MRPRILVLSDSVDFSLQLEKLLSEANELEITASSGVALDLLDDFDPHIFLLLHAKDSTPSENIKLIEVAKHNYLDRDFRTVCAVFTAGETCQEYGSLVDFQLNLPVSDRELSLVLDSLKKLLDLETENIDLKSNFLSNKASYRLWSKKTVSVKF